jgi:nicotinamidase-related amidase
VYVVADAVGGTSVTAHEMALRRIEQAGGKMISLTQLLCELQRDWQRKETVPAFMKLFIETGGTMGIQLSYDHD